MTLGNPAAPRSSRDLTESTAQLLFRPLVHDRKMQDEPLEGLSIPGAAVCTGGRSERQTLLRQPARHRYYLWMLLEFLPHG